MWYQTFNFRYAMPILGIEPNKFCPLCAKLGIKTPINKSQRNDGSGIFYSCADYKSKRHSPYIYDKGKTPNPPPMTEAEVDAFLKRRKEGNVSEEDMLEVMYCPVCAKNNREKVPVHRKKTKQGKEFWACSKNNKFNNFKACPYREYEDGPPLNEQAVDQLIAHLVELSNKEVAEKFLETGATHSEEESLIDKFLKDKKVIISEEEKELGVFFKCPLGHNTKLVETSTGKTKQCLQCKEESKSLSKNKRDAVLMVYRFTNALNSPNFHIFEFQTKNSREINVDLETNDVSISKKLSEQVSVNTPLLEVFGNFSTYDIEQDQIAFKEAEASPEFDKGQGSIEQGVIKIMTPEERLNIPINTDGVIKGINYKSSFVKRSIDDYDILEEYFGIDVSQQVGESNDGRILLLMDRGLYDSEKCENAKQSPLYAFTEIGALGHTPNPSQANALELLERDDSRHLILCLPTGVGKTTVAEAAIADGKIRGQKVGLNRPLAVYVCPARALAAQVSLDFTKQGDLYTHPFVKLGWKTSMLRGVKRDIDEDHKISQKAIQKQEIGFSEETYSDNVEEWQKNLEPDPNQADIIIITPEKLLRCLQNPASHQWVSRINTFIFDEGHIIGDTSRGPDIETENIEIYEKFKELREMISGAARIVYMSATMQNAIELVSWQQNMTDSGDIFQGIDAERQSKWAIVWGEWKPVETEIIYKVLGGKDNNQAAADLSLIMKDEPTDKDKQTVDEYKEENIRTPQEEKQHEISVLKDIVSNVNMIVNKDGDVVIRPTLLFVQVKSDGYNLQETAKVHFWQCKKCGKISLAPKSAKGLPLFPSDKTLCFNCGGRMGQWEVPFHNADVSPEKQQKFVDNFNNDYKKYPLLIATSTLAAGVNTGAYTVIIYNVHRGGVDVETSQIIQEIGRAGRQKYLAEFPHDKPRVIVYLEHDRDIYDKRRINAKAYLESQLNNHRRLTDSVLRAISILGVKDAQSCGKYIASTFGFFQNVVDLKNELNTRRGLEHISSSYNHLIGQDYVQWKYPGRGADFPNAKECKHDHLIDVTRSVHLDHKGDKQKIFSMLGAPVDDEGDPMFIFVCKSPLLDKEGQVIIGPNGQPALCGAMGYMKQISKVYRPDVLLDYAPEGTTIDDLVEKKLVDRETMYTIPEEQTKILLEYFPGDSLQNLESKGYLKFIPSFNSFYINPDFLKVFMKESGFKIEELIDMGIIETKYKDKLNTTGLEYLYVKRSEDIVKDLVSVGFATIEDGEYKITTLGRQISNCGMSAADAVELIKNMYGVNFNPKETSPIELAFALGNLSRFDDPQEEGAYLSLAQQQACLDTAMRLGVEVSPRIKQIQSLLWILEGVHPTDKNVHGEYIIPKCMHRSYYNTLSYFGDNKFLIGFSILAAKAGWYINAPEELEALKVQFMKSDRRAVVPKYLTPLVAVKGIGVYTARALYDCGVSNIPELLSSDPATLANRIQEYYKESDKKKSKQPNYLARVKGWMEIAKAAIEGEQEELKGRPLREKIAYLYSVRVLNYPEYAKKMIEGKDHNNLDIDKDLEPIANSSWYKYYIRYS